jgi:hypothetical protein
MKKVGWELQPLGWLLLIIGIVVSCYVILGWVRCPFPPSEKEA